MPAPSPIAPNASSAPDQPTSYIGRYKLADGVAQVHNFSLVMRTNFSDIDFANHTPSPTDKSQPATAGNLPSATLI
jgi:hypothetical protein